VAILFALVFTFMFVLFCFVVDFAHLINTKINLQMAADAAAYAGASWQARTLNKLGLINYRMRQNLKEFTMRLQVTHLRHNRNFPRGVPVDTEQSANVEPFICQQAHGYRALSGLRYDQDTNLCRNASPTTGGLPPIVVPPVIASFDPFAVAIAAQIRRIADAANQECRAAAEDNRVLAEHLIAVYRQRSQFHFEEAQKIANFLNQALQPGAGGRFLSRDGETHPIRKIAATTFYNNLSFTNDQGDETITDGTPSEARIEILGSTEENNSVVLRQHPINGSVLYFDFNVVGDGCVGRPAAIDFDGMLAGFSKVQKVVTYFAVRAEAKPKLFFMPQAWANQFPRLVAYSAAKPFGSRLGPDRNADILVPVANRPGNNNRAMNFSFVPGDQLGLNHQGLMSLLDSLHPTNSIGRPDGDQRTGWPREDNGRRVATAALQAIRAPTVFDAIFYTVFPDPVPASNYLESGIAARLFPDNMEASDVAGVALNLNESAGELPEDARVRMVANEGAGDPRYDNYATEGRASHSVPLASQLGLGLPLNKWASRELVHSGWTPRTSFPNRGRIGYSVKFISMEALTATLVVRDPDAGGSSLRIANPPTNVDGNITFVKH
jgi:hypothetical protein